MEQQYIFHNTCFERELLRKQRIVLNDNGIDYKVDIKEDVRNARVPQIGYFEAEIYIHKNEFEKADPLLKALIEKYS